MSEWILQYAVYLTVAAGILVGVPVVLYAGYNFGKPRMMSVIFACVYYSFVSVISVLLWASLESLLFSGKWSFGSVSTYGIYIIAPLFLWLYPAGKQRASFYDAYALYVGPSMVLQRIRCILNGCCQGKIIPGSEIRWPAREAEILFYIMMSIFFLKLIKEKRHTEGDLFPRLMISYSIFRFIAEWFREGTGIIHPAHLWSVLVCIIGLSIYLEIRKKTQTGR